MKPRVLGILHLTAAALLGVAAGLGVYGGEPFQAACYGASAGINFAVGLFWCGPGRSL